MNTTPLDTAIAAAASAPDGRDGIARIAAACGTSKQFIHKMRRHWRETGSPPKALREYAAAIEAATSGIVSVETLYPTVEWLRDGAGKVIGYTVPVELPAANDASESTRAVG